MIKIGFLPITIWDVLDILIVGYLIYQIYKLLKGSIAFNIFIGVITLFITYWIVDALNMLLLSRLLNSLAQTGVVILVIIFQPEIRRFLLLLGDTTLRQRSNFWNRLFDRAVPKDVEEKQRIIKSIKTALQRMSKQKIGALMVLANELNLSIINNSGIKINAQISAELLQSIFNKESPLHDGAVMISQNKIQSAGCILPVSENPHLPSNIGLRHRAGIGITEKAKVLALIVSEETGQIAYACEGHLYRNLSDEKLSLVLDQFYV